MNQAELERIQDLPEQMAPIKIEEEIKKLNKIKERGNKAKNFLILEAYLELAYRQYHTNKLLERHLREELDNNIISLWDKECIESTESILALVGRLGLSKSFEIVKSSVNDKMDDEIREEIEAAIEEYKNGVENPYNYLD